MYYVGGPFARKKASRNNLVPGNEKQKNKKNEKKRKNHTKNVTPRSKIVIFFVKIDLIKPNFARYPIFNA